MTTDTRAPLGCLILHGLTSSLKCVEPLAPHLEAQQIPCAMPILRGHGTRPEDLRGVGWQEWYADADAALTALLRRCRTAVVVGHSMGGVTALHLAVQRASDLAGVVAVAAALELPVPMKPLWPLLGRLGTLSKLDVHNAFEDQALAETATNYPSVPLSAVYSLIQFGRLVQQELPRLRLPLLTIYTPLDRVVTPAGARLPHERVSTPADQRRLLAFDHSGHEMFMDRQGQEVCTAITTFIVEQRQARGQ